MSIPGRGSSSTGHEDTAPDPPKQSGAGPGRGVVAYYTHARGPAKDPWLARDVPGVSCDVLESRDNPVPIGVALSGGWDHDGTGFWELTARGIKLPGRWVVIDREFKPAQ